MSFPYPHPPNVEMFWTELKLELVKEGGPSGLISFLEFALEQAKTEANIEAHIRAFRARTNPNSTLEDLR